VDLRASGLAPSPAAKFQQAPASPSKKHLLNVMLDTTPLSDVVLPPGLQPTAPALNGSFPAGTFYLQKDGKTGVLALVRNLNSDSLRWLMQGQGSFSGADFDVMQSGLLEGLLTLKEIGATQLIVDVVSLCRGEGILGCTQRFFPDQQWRRFHLYRTCEFRPSGIYPDSQEQYFQWLHRIVRVFRFTPYCDSEFQPSADHRAQEYYRSTSRSDFVFHCLSPSHYLFRAGHEGKRRSFGASNRPTDYRQKSGSGSRIAVQSTELEQRERHTIPCH
jgi:hypothetical protein